MMRVWEFEDNKAINSDIVREQDFIMRIRRLHRLGTEHLVLNIAFGELGAKPDAMNAKDMSTLHAIRDRLVPFAARHGGDVADMSNGDIFLIWPMNLAPQNGLKEIMPLLFSDGVFPEGFDDNITRYRLPDDYRALRERTNMYVEYSQSVPSEQGGQTPANALHSDAARGPLTAWSVNQVELLLQGIDVRRYLHTQPIYKYTDAKTWQPLFEEHFIGFDDLRRDHFPKLDITTPEHLFLELCQALDRKLLAELALHYDSIAEHRLSLNLSVDSINSPSFVQFTHQVPPAARSLIGFELHRGDLFGNFEQTLNAITLLHNEGYKVLIDSITPDMLPYINIGLFNVDYIKLNVAKDRAAQLKNSAAQKALAQIPREKLIFFRCDNELALAIGHEFGVTKFQGWLIDAVVQAKK